MTERLFINLRLKRVVCRRICSRLEFELEQNGRCAKSAIVSGAKLKKRSHLKRSEFAPSASILMRTACSGTP